MTAAPPAPQPPAPPQPQEQLRYAQWVDRASQAGLLLLVLLFAVYALGLGEPLVPHARLAEVWGLPVAEFRAATGLPAGWDWLRQAHHADIANLLGVTLLAGCSVLALLALMPLYARRGERLYALLAAAEAAVILLAASGLPGAGH